MIQVQWKFRLLYFDLMVLSNKIETLPNVSGGFTHKWRCWWHDGDDAMSDFVTRNLFCFFFLQSDHVLSVTRCNQAHGRDNKASKTTSRTMLQGAPNTQHAARSTACCLDSPGPRDVSRPLFIDTNSTLLLPTFQSPLYVDFGLLRRTSSYFHDLTLIVTRVTLTSIRHLWHLHRWPIRSMWWECGHDRALFCILDVASCYWTDEI